eukprot:CAMPEP_0113847300 /NCGR_PEP_ID=MMETSP0372-20130328/1793_1 /TAXON_ID=340204 /ORGANISM="Lankesteria abbotti" /LENGTH=149 /DNA_ID=CAMNT_0000816553 /DNA_START=67 /DNA_END=516 /DNA_ORIENTATION=+ /assembly_acc=CAM_ASM_000359
MAPRTDKASAAVKKAQNAATAARHSVTTKKRKVRTSTKFKRPRTKRLPRAPKYAACPVPKRNKMDEFRIIKTPVATESAMKKIEECNTLVFLCDPRANKQMINEAAKKLFSVKPVKINTLVRLDGLKKAYIRLPKESDALDVANKIGVI